MTIDGLQVYCCNDSLDGRSGFASKAKSFNRIFHSVEMTLLIAVAASLDYVFDGLLATQRLLVLMLIAAAVTVIGHMVAILNSSRLR